ncbi:MAG: carbohydrate ABC transporter permease [Castellaniella sp.]|uniref:carbohydrate ABC transporter permease n=1 Tax=Castellaniella sp. TaxID=1955812 RepID=UPI00120B622B|nr:carbohydrate ABC transporter permease [Castellaniella sp.]TAN27765.1 MAG: carbohydrate ABC transporter permease [Castellaniella sp.]
MLAGSLKAFRRRVPLIVICIALVFSLAPVVWFLLTSLKDRSETFQIPPAWFFTPTLDHYKNVMGFGGKLTSLYQAGRIDNFFDAAVNSIVIAVGSTLLSTFLGTIAAFGFARFRIKWENALLAAYLLIRMVPAVSLVLPLYRLFGFLGLNDTYTGMIIAESTFQVPFVVWMMTGFIRQVPASLEESGMIDGLGRFGAMMRITLPLISSGLFATVVFNFVQAWNDFLYPLVLTSQHTQTLPVTIIGFIADGNIFWGEMAAAGILVVLPVLLFSMLAQRYVLAGATAGAVKG